MALALPSWQEQLNRKRLVTLGFFAFALLLAYIAAGYVINNDLSGLAYTGLLILMCGFVVAILNDWRNGVYFFLAWLLLEDLARKFLGNNMTVYFAKDALLLIVYLAFFAAYRGKSHNTKIFRPPFLVPLMFLVWFGVLQIFNPASSSIFYGLLGIKLYFLYVPLLFVGYSLVDSEESLRKFFQVNLCLMLVIIALGIVQSVLGPTFLNPAVPADDIRLLSQTYREAPISGVRVYRPTSVFVGAGRFQDLLIVAWILVFGFSAYLLLRHKRGRNFAFIALTLTSLGCVMSSSRGVFMWTLGTAVVGISAFTWGAPWRQGEARRVLRTLNRVLLAIALGSVVLLATHPEAFLNRLAVYSETLDPRSPVSELSHRTREYPMRNFLAAFTYDRWPYGYGIGTVSLGGQYVSRFFNVRPAVGGVESGFGSLVVEMGIGGFILWLTMALSLVVSAWRVVKKLRGSPWFPIAFMIFWYAFLLLIPLTYEGMQAYQDFILNAYLWLLVGILFRLPTLALSARFAGPAVPSSFSPRVP